MIDIIIPAYNAHSTIENTLKSICYQTISDKLNVYVVNDKSEKDYHEIVDKYKKYINIQEIDLKENVGPGITREEGLKASSSEYFMFIDADDVFASPKSIEICYKEMTENDLDLVIGRFIECYENSFYQHLRDVIWLHGKMFKRSFVEKNNIHFNNTRADEDNFFLQCYVLSDPKTHCIDYPIYFWNFNLNSITRKNNFEYSNSMIGYINNMENALLFAVENNKKKDLIGEKALCVLYVAYHNYLDKHNDDNFKLLTKIKKIYDDTKEYIKDEQEMIDIQYNLALRTIDKEILDNPSISFEEFCRKIGE